MILLQTIYIEETQSHHLAFGFWQNEPDIIIKGKLGKTINIQRIVRFTFLYESFFSIAVNCGAGSIKKINLVFKAMVEQRFGIFVIVGQPWWLQQPYILV